MKDELRKVICHNCGVEVPLNDFGIPIFGISIEAKGVSLDLCMECFAGALRVAAAIFIEKKASAAGLDI